MAGNYSILSTLNQKSTEKMDKTSYARSKTEDISIYDIYSNEQNFYDQEGVEQKAQEIFAVGLIEPLAVIFEEKEIDGELKHYRLVSGERRWRALLLLASQGHKRFSLVTCKILEFSNVHEEKVSLILANSYRQKSMSTLIREEQELKAELEYMKCLKIPLNGFDLNAGKIRDVVASIMNISKTKVAEIEAVSNHLLSDFKCLLDTEKITFSAAYQLSKLQIAEQEELFNRYREEGELSYKSVLQYAQEKKEEQQKEQLPGQMDFNEVEAAFDKTKVEETKEIVGEENSKSVVEDDVDNSEKNEPEVTQKQVEGDVFLFYKHTMRPDERTLFHNGELSLVKSKLCKRLNHIGTGGAYSDGYNYQTQGGGWIRFSGTVAHSMTIYQILNVLKKVLEDNPMFEIADENIADKQIDSTKAEGLKEETADSEIKKPFDGVQKTDYDIRSDIALLKSLIDSHKRILNLAQNDNAVTEITKKKHDVSLRAFEFYLEFLKGGGGEHE